MKAVYCDSDLQEETGKRRWFKNVKLVGEIDERTSVYIEDYAYTYLKQCATSDLSYELCTVLIGENHKESNQIVIYGVIPVDAKLLDKDTKWIGESILGAIEDERRCYFPEGEYVGWMHTQPGYGIMPTTKEMAVHKDIFGEDCMLMLIDPVYNTEGIFICNNNKFEQKNGFCIYYERNELMQKYMEDHSFMKQKQNEVKDKVIEDFRKLGTEWKKEVERKRRMSRMINITLGGIFLTLALIIGVQSQQKKINQPKNEVVKVYRHYSENENK